MHWQDWRDSEKDCLHLGLEATFDWDLQDQGLVRRTLNDSLR